MNTARSILSRFHSCTRSIYCSITICKKPCTTCCICSHAAIFHISSTICCQNSSSYTIEAGIVSALAVCRSSCNRIIIKCYVCSGRNQCCILVSSCWLNCLIWYSCIFYILIYRSIAVHTLRLSTRTSLTRSTLTITTRTSLVTHFHGHYCNGSCISIFI